MAGRVWDAVVQYAFGSGDRGLTLVGRDPAGRAYELRLSDYPDAHGEARRAKPRAAVGRDLRASAQAVACRGIPGTAADRGRRPPLPDSATSPTRNRSSTARARAPATGRSAANVATGRGATTCWPSRGSWSDHDPAIARPTLASGERIVKLCAGCHSPRGQDVRRDDPTAARFQATTLTWSRCYTESDDRLDCITCHDPHRNASTVAGALRGSVPGMPLPGPPARPARATATVAAAPCSATARPARPARSIPPPAASAVTCRPSRASCPTRRFTDHFIRVHRD